MDILKSLNHPEEIKALFRYKFAGGSVREDLNTDLSKELRRCYYFLNKTSRSFSAVIQALDGELRHAVCIFYLVLRALDTVEDDMTIPVETKIPMLNNFYTFLEQPDWSFNYSEEKDKMVLEEFPVISSQYRALDPLYQTVISDITQKMGQGMTVYLDKAPDTLEDWDEYCHYVAGLVGIGLSRLFAASGLEDSIVGQDTELANSMGLFLQKTNIIRDYLEDVNDGREFWPKQVWGRYGSQQKDLLSTDKYMDALTVLNELVTNALHHVPDCIKYMSRLKNQSIFNFCAIPQVMAIATLERCYYNYQVFTGVVKIRKGEAVRLMNEATSLNNVKAIMANFLRKIKLRAPRNEKLSQKTLSVIDNSLRLTETKQYYRDSSAFSPLYVSCAMLTGAIVWQYWTAVTSMAEHIYSS